jgi:phosphatidylglycerophosphatase A
MAPDSPPRTVRDRVLMALATGFGSGLAPVAPGTAGSVVGLVLAWPLLCLPLAAYGAVTVAVAGLAVAAAGHAERHFGAKDPGAIVIDEIAGMFVTLVAVAPTAVNLLAGFLLFRLFDIVKPFPCRWAERRFSGGLGVVADDLMAGVYACACLHLAAPLLERGRALLGG